MLPGVVALLVLSAVYVAFGTTTAVAALFAGLAPAVLAIVAQAVVRVGRRALTGPALVSIAVASFLALALFAVPFPVVVLWRESWAGRCTAGGRRRFPRVAARRSRTPVRPR